MSTESENVLVGRKANGEKVYVQAKLKHPADNVPGVPNARQTVTHETTTERLALSITGVIIREYGNIENDQSWLGCGQTRDDLLELAQLEPGWTVGTVAKLHEIWQRWHLNDMRSMCEHQRLNIHCPKDYEQGSAWLFESLPFGVIAFICDRFDIEQPAPGVDTH